MTPHSRRGTREGVTAGSVGSATSLPHAQGTRTPSCPQNTPCYLLPSFCSPGPLQHRAGCPRGAFPSQKSPCSPPLSACFSVGVLLGGWTALATPGISWWVDEERGQGTQRHRFSHTLTQIPPPPSTAQHPKGTLPSPIARLGAKGPPRASPIGSSHSIARCQGWDVGVRSLFPAHQPTSAPALLPPTAPHRHDRSRRPFFARPCPHPSADRPPPGKPSHHEAKDAALATAA